jgi:hypothetical protein
MLKEQIMGSGMGKLVASLAVTAVLGLGGLTPAFADATQPVQPNPNPQVTNSVVNSGQCVGWDSAVVTHNGGAVSDQAQSTLGREYYIDLAQVCQ